MSATARLEMVPRSPLLKFTVGELNCALPLEDVQEIIAMVWVTPLPGAGSHLLGVIDCHGTPCPVIDIRRLLNLPSAPIQPQHHLVVLRLAAELLAIPCDQADAVTWGSMRPVAGTRGTDQVIQGLLQEADSVTLVLDPANLLKGSPISPSRLSRLRGSGRLEAARTEVG